MAKYLRISMGDSPENLIDIFPVQEVGRVTWDDFGDGGVSVSAAPAGEVGQPKARARGVRGAGGLDGLGAMVTSKLQERAEEMLAKGRATTQAAQEAEASAEKARNPERRREPEPEDDDA